jgi:hypothetical protein
MDDATALTKRRKDSPQGAGHNHLTHRYTVRVRALKGGVEVANTDHVRIINEVGGTV